MSTVATDAERERLAKRVSDALYYVRVGADSWEGARKDRANYEAAVAELAAYDALHGGAA